MFERNPKYPDYLGIEFAYLNRDVGRAYDEFCTDLFEGQYPDLDLDQWDCEDDFFKEFEMGYNPHTKRYEKGYRLPDGSNFNKNTTTWKNFLTPDTLQRDFVKFDDETGWYHKEDFSKILRRDEYDEIMGRAPKMDVSTETKPTKRKGECSCIQPKTAPKNVYRCNDCGQSWKKESFGWKRIADWVYDEVVGPAPKPRKPRAKKADLTKPRQPGTP